jgi:hypothetical protein
MKPTAAILFASALCLTVAVSCSAKPYFHKYQAGVAANKERLQTLRVGMTRAEVEAVMGAGVVVNYKKIQLRNPYRYETLKVSDSKTAEVLYYVTDGRVWEAPETSTLTPLLFENDRLIGWGWAFVGRDKPKYVSGPPESSGGTRP